jgi:hypothetical protein
VRFFSPFHFHEKRLYYELTNAGRFPEHTLRVDVKMKVSGFDVTANAGFFPGFLLGGLTV